jgi:glutathione S-transferase
VRTRHERLYHLAIAGDWETAKVANSGYRMSTLDEDLADVGFVHCSYARQVQRIADLVYRERDDVLLLTIDADALTSRVVDEAVEGSDDAEEFPHVYGPIDFAAVLDVRPLPLRPDGTLDIDLPDDTD